MAGAGELTLWGLYWGEGSDFLKRYGPSPVALFSSQAAAWEFGLKRWGASYFDDGQVEVRSATAILLDEKATTP